MCTFTIESTHFIFNKCPIYTNDGASAKFRTVKTTTHVHNYEHEQVPMVTDLHMRPVMGFLCLGTEAGGVYMQTLEAEIRHPHLATG